MQTANGVFYGELTISDVTTIIKLKTAVINFREFKSLGYNNRKRHELANNKQGKYQKKS